MAMAIPMSTREVTRDAAPRPAEESRVSAADDAMDRYANGEASAFETVYDEIAPALERFFAARVGAERRPELIVETFLTMHRRRGTFIRGSAVLPWAIAIGERLVRE